MKQVLSVGTANVFDKVLPIAAFQQLWLFMNNIPYARSDAHRWTKVWTLADGAILRGPEWSGSAPEWEFFPPKNEGQPAFPVSPPPLMALFNVVLNACKENESMPEVRKMVFIPHVYPPNRSISWHTDGQDSDAKRIGAFTFYVHKEWNAEWGGELLLSQVDCTVQYRPPFDNSAMSEQVMSEGHGIWISPKPNRLVINPSDMLHKVAKTTEGAAPRLSIQGFLYSHE